MFMPIFSDHIPQFVSVVKRFTIVFATTKHYVIHAVLCDDISFLGWLWGNWFSLLYVRLYWKSSVSNNKVRNDVPIIVYVFH